LRPEGPPNCTVLCSALAPSSPRLLDDIAPYASYARLDTGQRLDFASRGQNLQKDVISATRVIMESSVGTRPNSGIASEAHSHTFVTPPPIALAATENVVTAAGMIVLSADGTIPNMARSRITQFLALIAPLPEGLPRSTRLIMHQYIVSTTCMVVVASGLTRSY
jgi:hypothetical protein